MSTTHYFYVIKFDNRFGKTQLCHSIYLLLILWKEQFQQRARSSYAAFIIPELMCDWK